MGEYQQYMALVHLLAYEPDKNNGYLAAKPDLTGTINTELFYRINTTYYSMSAVSNFMTGPSSVIKIFS